MSNEASDYNLKAIRQLLLAAFTPEELRRFCYDRPSFRPIVDQFSPKHSLADMADELITYCETRLLFDELLAEVNQINPDQYTRFAPDLYSPEKVRAMELAYLDDLLEDYKYWLEHYTPLAGIAEVRAAVKDGPRLDLPMPFIPPGFDKLVERGDGELAEVQRVEVDDLSAAVAEHRRILLLGDPGAGKTTTLWRLCYDYSLAARQDAAQPLPLLVPLGGYDDDGPFDAFLGRRLGPLAPYLKTYRASGRLILLLDGLNEMPQADYAERVGRIQKVLDHWPEEMVVVTCRELDYVEELEGLQRVEVSPLDEARIRTFLHNYLGETAGERLFRAMVGEEPPALLALGRNPYLLLMTTQVYVGSGERLPANRARLFADFVDTLLAREKERHPERWLPAERQVDALAALAYAMQVEGGRGTTVERPWAANLLRQAVPELDAEQLLYLATSATLLDADEASSRFYHQLLQEFFAARELGRRFAAGQAMSRYWPGGHWWEPSGWEETTILLAGLEPDASKLLAELSSANPVVAARCLVEGDAQVDEGTRAYIIGALIDSMTDAQTPPVARAQAGDALALVGDPRPGVMTMEGMPFCYVPPGPFWMGEGEAEHLNKELDYSYWMARYPVTNAQFQAFVDAGGYQERAHWPEAEEAGFWQGGLFKGRYDKEARDGPVEYGDPFSLSNHPVVGVTWYEALAYCRWLAGCLRKGGHLAEGRTVSLPSGAEWEKAARGGLEVPEQPIITLAGERGDVPLRKSPHPKQVYPWGDETAPNRANYRETGIGTTSAVGCFPGGASPYGVEELSGNVWEWTRSVYKSYPYDPKDGRESLRAGFDAPRVLHGGSFSNIQWIVRCAFRSGNDPDFRNGYYGFRLCVAARQE